MKILVTGATGFVGNHLIPRLLEKNLEVIATSRSREKAQECSWYKDVSFIEFDFDHQPEDNLYRLFNQPDKLIHLAWKGLPNYKSIQHLEENVFSHFFFLKNLIRHGLTDLNIVGTCLEYGLREGCQEENACTTPTTHYGLAKNTLRLFVEALQADYDFHFKWVRLYYIYGRGQNEKSLFSQLKKAVNEKWTSFNMSKGEQIRDFIPLPEASKYLIDISLQDEIQGVINCCSGQPISVRRFVENFFQENNYEIELNLGFYPYPDYEPLAFWGDTHKLNRIINSHGESV